MNFHLFLFGYIVGVAFGLFFVVPIFPYICLAFGVGVFVVWFRFETVRVIALGSVLVAVGYIHSRTVMDRWQSIDEGLVVSGRAEVVREPGIKDRGQEVILRFVDCPNGLCPTRYVMGMFSVYDVFAYSDVLDVKCLLRVPENFRDDFDYRMYLATQGIGFICSPKEWSRTDIVSGNVFVRAIFQVRKSLEGNMDQVVAYPESGLGKGLLFGGSDYLTRETQAMFSRTGMSHIVAVSGANVVIIAESIFLLAIACGLWRKQAVFVAVVGVGIFVIMVGAGASAVRAGLMGGLVLAAGYGGRLSDGIRLWTIALVVMTVWNPLSLRYDLGFQLSFLATLGILLCMPLFERVYLDRRSFLPVALAEILFITIAAELFVLPIILYNFHILSMVSLAANVLVLPAIPLAMFFGFLASVFGFVWMPLSKIFGLITYLILHYMLGAVDLLAGYDHASIESVRFGFWHAIVWYGCLFGGIVWLKRGEHDISLWIYSRRK